MNLCRTLVQWSELHATVTLLTRDFGDLIVQVNQIQDLLELLHLWHGVRCNYLGLRWGAFLLLIV